MNRVLSVTVLLLALVSCGPRKEGSSAFADPKESYTIGNCSIRMSPLPGGALTMGAFMDGRKSDENGKIRMETVGGFAISAQPVSQALWEEVMGSNPSSVKNPNLPVDMVSSKDIEKFLSRLSRRSGVPFILPDEAMWEFALRQGSISPEKGIREWCAGKGLAKPVRTAVTRDMVPEPTKAAALTFRLAFRSGKPCPGEAVKIAEGQSPDREESCIDEQIALGDVVFDMVAVPGGIKKLGVTDVQKKYADEDEAKEFEAQVADFEISRTEVTVAQWLEVMGYLPYGNYAQDADYPVVNVSWYAASEFILRLREKTGRKFRLPTEIEWEYAATGGDKGYGYRYSGSNQVDVVAVYAGNNPDLKVKEVGSLFNNELGLFDMSGNAWEWCEDSYTGTESGDVKIMRGGSAASKWNACRVSNRSKANAGNVKGTFGFRLAI